jgi:hypothetical protein
VKEGKLYHRLPLDLAGRTMTAKDPRKAMLSPFPVFSTIADLVAGFKALQASHVIVKPGETKFWWTETGRRVEKSKYELLWSGPLCGSTQFPQNAMIIDRVLADHVASYVDSETGHLYRLLPAMSSDRPDWQEWAEAVDLVRKHIRSMRETLSGNTS